MAMNDIVERLEIDNERLSATVDAQRIEIERLRGAARFAHAAIKTYHTMYPHRATGALLDAAGRLWEVLDDE
jgi:hypothetical protein